MPPAAVTVIGLRTLIVREAAAGVRNSSLLNVMSLPPPIVSEAPSIITKFEIERGPPSASRRLAPNTVTTTAPVPNAVFEPRPTVPARRWKSPVRPVLSPLNSTPPAFCLTRLTPVPPLMFAVICKS